MTNKERIQQLEGYVPILRWLINYHKRMMLMGSYPCHKDNAEPGECEMCKEAAQNNGECPKATVLNDWYLGALEES